MVWLENEFNISKDGFYCNWSTIETVKNRYDSGIIVFISWTAGNGNGYIEIDIFIIHSDFRRLGHRKKLYD